MYRVGLSTRNVNLYLHLFSSFNVLHLNINVIKHNNVVFSRSPVDSTESKQVEKIQYARTRRYHTGLTKYVVTHDEIRDISGGKTVFAFTPIARVHYRKTIFGQSFLISASTHPQTRESR